MNYKSLGKEYCGEKAIISLTSWKTRISTCPKTIFSLLKMCPGFHIVLVLSEEEFPQKEKELPENLMIFVDNKLIELLWVYKNCKSFKKVIFTMDKYKDVPIISADDDCIYTCNYAEILYDKWKNNKDSFISFWCTYYKDIPHTGGYATLHPPNCYKLNLEKIEFEKFDLTEDDVFYTAIRYILKLTKNICLNKHISEIVISHDEINPLHEIYRKTSKNLNKKIEKMILSILPML